MVDNLSAGKENSINEFIDPQLCTVHYSTLKKAVTRVVKKMTLCK
jgi:hypothetical protein